MSSKDTLSHLWALAAAEARRVFRVYWGPFFAGCLFFLLIQPALLALWINFLISNGYVTAAEVTKSLTGYQIYFSFVIVIIPVILIISVLPTLVRALVNVTRGTRHSIKRWMRLKYITFWIHHSYK